MIISFSIIAMLFYFILTISLCSSFAIHPKQSPLHHTSQRRRIVPQNNNDNININQLEQENIDYSNNIDEGNGNAGGWNTDNMSVIAYIYNIITKEIVQVEEVDLNN